MWTFFTAGILYLLGVAVVLFAKPQFMFSPDGNWKEFGIGQREDRYTPFPFWLFCIVWAIVSYVILLLLLTPKTVETPFRTKKRNQSAEIDYDHDDGLFDFDEDVRQLPKGYYVLNKKATRLSGIPKYVYLGANEPGSTSAETV